MNSSASIDKHVVITQTSSARPPPVLLSFILPHLVWQTIFHGKYFGELRSLEKVILPTRTDTADIISCSSFPVFKAQVAQAINLALENPPGNIDVM